MVTKLNKRRAEIDKKHVDFLETLVDELEGLPRPHKHDPQAPEILTKAIMDYVEKNNLPESAIFGYPDNTSDLEALKDLDQLRVKAHIQSAVAIYDTLADGKTNPETMPEMLDQHLEHAGKDLETIARTKKISLEDAEKHIEESIPKGHLNFAKRKYTELLANTKLTETPEVQRDAIFSLLEKAGATAKDLTDGKLSDEHVMRGINDKIAATHVGVARAYLMHMQSGANDTEECDRRISKHLDAAGADEAALAPANQRRTSEDMQKVRANAKASSFLKNAITAYGNIAKSDDPQATIDAMHKALEKSGKQLSSLDREGVLSEDDIKAEIAERVALAENRQTERDNHAVVAGPKETPAPPTAPEEAQQAATAPQSTKPAPLPTSKSDRIATQQAPNHPNVQKARPPKDGSWVEVVTDETDRIPNLAIGLPTGTALADALQAALKRKDPEDPSQSRGR